MTDQFKQFFQEYVAKAAPLEKAYNLAHFEATISGRKADYDRSADLEIQFTHLLADREAFAKLKRFKQSGAITEPLLHRQLDVLYNDFLEKQIDVAKLEAMIRLQSEIENKYYTFRVEVDGKKLTDNEIDAILRTSTNSQQLRTVWEASKTIGPEVAADVVRLAKLRNEAARELGFRNYHEMQLSLNEQDPAEIAKIFDELDTLTRETFAQVKSEMDEVLAKRCAVAKDELMPWHYQSRFFQEAPRIYNVDLDNFYKGKDLVSLAKKYYAGISMPIEAIVAKSDLFEKEGKYQHAYCTNIDRGDDVRVVCNVKPDYSWMGTLLHEYGHAVYDKFLDRGLPWELREPAHTFTTEAIAMLFGRMAANSRWLEDVAGVPTAEAEPVAGDCFKSLRLEELAFSRWAQVMYRFEKAMYENPDQDLNALWWQLVERYQMLRKPAGRNVPDWASKIHLATVPAYYHNYMLGELLASQLNNYIVTRILKANPSENQSYAGRPEVGRFLVEKVFRPGKRYPWNDMIQRATGEKLTARHFAVQFVHSPESN